jgi:hypothetical protein
VRTLTAAAREILEGERGTTSEQMLSSIERTLRYASLDDEQRAPLASGRLTNEVEAAGFDAFAGMALPAAPPPRLSESERAEAPARQARPSQTDATRERRKRVSAAQAELKAAREQEREAREALRNAERAERGATQELKRASARRAAAQEAVDAAAAATHDALTRLDDARAS